jgi:hypothetical protein
MALNQVLAEFQAKITQCDNLISNAHIKDKMGAYVLPLIDPQQISIAAFLNMFIAWEEFLESSIMDLMIGMATISGRVPVKYVNPASTENARQLIIGINRYFDYGNHDYVKKIILMYFDQGYPFEPHLSSIISDLADLRTMRNAAAHISSTTQNSLDSLATRIFAKPARGIKLYDMLTAIYPRSSPAETVFATYKNKLNAAAELIANG